MATWREEFPDFPVEDMIDIPQGFVDQSWHNDTCPCFDNERAGLRLWVDYKDKAQREMPNVSSRFLLTDIDGEHTIIAHSETWDVIERAICQRYVDIVLQNGVKS